MKPYENIVDSHFHLASLIERGVDAQALLNELFSGGFLGGINVCLSEEELEKTLPLTEGFPLLKTSFGLGPWETKDPNSKVEDWIQRIRLARKKHNFSFLGEFGLDLHWEDYGSLSRQMELARAQLDLAAEFSMPVIIHSRQACREIESLLLSHDNPYGGIIHCYSGDKSLAFKLIDRGYFISFAGNITYKHSEALLEVLKTLPVTSILFETDSPYLPPVPYRGKVNDPRKTVEIYAFASKILGLEKESLVLQVAQNFKRLLSSLKP